MPEAILYEKLNNNAVKCHVCQWHCTIKDDCYGLCGIRYNHQGILNILNYGVVSSVAADPIEKKPLFHFYPGSKVLSLGSWGCNFHCLHCQNWQISMIRLQETIIEESQFITPEYSITLAKDYNCEGIAWTYNEPAIWLEYTVDAAKLAKEAGLYTVYVTNGYSTIEALDEIGPFLDAYRVDFKGFSDLAYRKLAKIYKWEGILEVTKRAKYKWGIHVEVVTNIIPSINDDTIELERMAQWIHDNLGELTPWHVTRFHPSHRMLNIPATPLSTLERACQIGKKAGLKFVYIGNIPGHSVLNTTCYSCGNIIIERTGGHIQSHINVTSRCNKCGAEVNVITKSRYKR